MAGGRGRWICKLGRAGGSGPRPAPARGCSGRSWSCRKVGRYWPGPLCVGPRNRGGRVRACTHLGRNAGGACEHAPYGGIAGRQGAVTVAARIRAASCGGRPRALAKCRHFAKGFSGLPGRLGTGRVCLGGPPSHLPTVSQPRPVRLGRTGSPGARVPLRPGRWPRAYRGGAEVVRGPGSGPGRGHGAPAANRKGRAHRPGPPCPVCDLSWSAGNSCSAHSRHSAR